MTKNFYRKEYSFEGWKALVDQAESLGCELTYSKYGSYLTVDSTKVEDKLMIRNEHRPEWAETIYNNLDAVARKAEKTVE